MARLGPSMKGSLPARMATAVVFVSAIALARHSIPRGPNVHVKGADCGMCHTATAAVLNANVAAARTRIRPDTDSVCLRCHSNEGPSHKTGIRPKRAVPPTLPLASDGRIICATCHFVHGESNAFGSFDRIDNRRGKMCLTCHTLAELQ